jgi:hypothetical protein
VPLLHFSQLTDFSEDNAAELAASGLPRRWVEAFAGMTTETRRVWKRPVDAIRDMPPGLDGLKPARYARMLASYGTYGRGVGLPDEQREQQQEDRVKSDRDPEQSADE